MLMRSGGRRTSGRDAAAVAVAATPEQVVEILRYVTAA
jgi:hypothetical protein